MNSQLERFAWAYLIEQDTQDVLLGLLLMYMENNTNAEYPTTGRGAAILKELEKSFMVTVSILNMVEQSYYPSFDYWISTSKIIDRERNKNA